MMYILQVENLYKSYNHVEAVKGISFSIKQGDIWAFGSKWSRKKYINQDDCRN